MEDRHKLGVEVNKLENKTFFTTDSSTPIKCPPS